MYKSTSESGHFMRRAGSFSTHGSRRGYDLLGHGEQEDMTDEQRRACYVQVWKGLQEQLKQPNLSKQDRESLGKDIHAVQVEINKIRPKKKCPGVNDYIIDILREELSKKQFDILMTRAVKRMEDANGGFTQ